MISTHEVKPVEERQDTVESVNLREATSEQLKQLADGVVNNPENQEQVKFFPDQWNSLNDEEKAEFAWQLTAEIQKSITELNDLWIVYSPEIFQGDVGNVAALEFVRANKDKILPLWLEVERKAEEVSKEIWKEVQKEIIEK